MAVKNMMAYMIKHSLITTVDAAFTVQHVVQQAEHKPIAIRHRKNACMGLVQITSCDLHLN